MKTSETKSLPKKNGSGRVVFLDGQGELPMLEVSTPWSTAEIYLHGAHVTRFRKIDETPLLFMSQCSRFNEGQPIRGGIPVVFPWFGMREGLGQHGFARVKTWDLKEFVPAPDGSVSIRFRLPDCPEASGIPPFLAEYVVTVSAALELKLSVTNESKDESLSFENCLHSYFEVGDVTAIAIHGLKSVKYLDKVANFASKTETSDAIRIASEVDRIYLDTAGAVEIVDPRLSRKIRIEKHGSVSTVVWNPWITRAQQMPDFGNDEYQRMICIETGNVASNQISLPPGETSTLRVKLSSSPLS
ncbi:MAG TPA: D-hexose-6-phosphate mutarotase [Candidatus Limnocylindrales bacterium]|jgi:D-hexose-6-phosphate mutarotase|nr:D-hexose-6-phosphate mutarotase [Candidatus Limnocylindrales bacterium]